MIKLCPIFSDWGLGLGWGYGFEISGSLVYEVKQECIRTAA